MTLWIEWVILLLKAFLRPIRLSLSWFSADHTVGRGGGAVLSKPAEVGGLQSWAGCPGPSRPPAETGRQDDNTRSGQVDTGFQHRRRAGGM